NTLPVLRIVEIDVRHGTFDRRTLRQERFEIRVEMFDLLLCFERPRQTHCATISMAHDTYILLRGFIDDGFVHFWFEIRRNLDEIIAVLLRLNDSSSCFGFCSYDVSVGGFASRKLWTGGVDHGRDDFSSGTLPAQNQLLRRAGHQTNRRHAVSDHDPEFIFRKLIRKFVVSKKMNVHVGQTGNQKLPRSVNSLRACRDLDSLCVTDVRDYAVAHD